MKIYKIDAAQSIDLQQYPTGAPEPSQSKKALKTGLAVNVAQMAELQNKLYAQDQYALLIVIQAMDAAGKDSLIRRAMSGLNPQGTQVTSFKQPSAEELDHDYLWRAHKNLPERGRIGIFNRSYYEEVLVVRVHDLVSAQKLPAPLISPGIWQQRFSQIRSFEKYLSQNGTQVVKIFLHISQEEQRTRFLDRIDDPSKNWKFSSADLKERAHWDEYQRCYSEAIGATASAEAPWYVVPADSKWYARLMVSQIIVSHMQQMGLSYPALTDEQLQQIETCRADLGEKRCE